MVFLTMMVATMTVVSITNLIYCLLTSGLILILKSGREEDFTRPSVTVERSA